MRAIPMVVPNKSTHENVSRIVALIVIELQSGKPFNDVRIKEKRHQIDELITELYDLTAEEIEFIGDKVAGARVSG